MIDNRLTNLNDCYVVTKKYNGKKYFVTRYSNDSKDSKYAVVFRTKDEAQKQMDDLNSRRTRIKYKLEKANEYFMNQYSVTIPWGDDKVCLENRFLALSEAIERKYVIKDDDKIFTENLIRDVQNRIENNKKRFKEIEDDYKQSLVQAEKDYDVSKKEAEMMKEKYRTLEGELKNLNLKELFKLHETKVETTYKVLYNK